VTTPSPAILLCDLLWHDRLESYFEVEQTVYRTAPVKKDDAYRRIRNGYAFFSPVPRTTAGNTRAHCATSFNALWCDIDYSSGLSKDKMLTKPNASLGPHDLYPSGIVFSGNRGLHIYFKIDRDLPIAVVESLNKRLIACCSGDRRAFDCTRLLRVPGTVNEKSDRRAELLDLCGHSFSPDAFEALPAETAQSAAAPGATAPAAHAPDALWRLAAESLSGWSEPDLRSLRELPAQFQIYMRSLPAPGWAMWGSPSRSEMEAKIVYRLIGKGWGGSDRQVRAIADEHFAKHRETTDDTYINRTIDSARAHLFDAGWISSPFGGYPRRRAAKYRHTSTTGADVVSLSLAKGQLASDWIREIRELGISRASAYRLRDRLRSQGAIEIIDGRIFPRASWPRRLTR